MAQTVAPSPRRRKKAAPRDAVSDLLARHGRLRPQERERFRLALLEAPVVPPTATRRRARIAAPPGASPLHADAGTPSGQLLAYARDVRDALAAYLPRDGYRPGDENRFDLTRSATMRALEPLEWLLKTYFRYEVHGLSHVPAQGRAIIVSNHGLLPIDGWFLAYEIARHRGRVIRGLTDWRIFRIPWLRRLFLDMGVVVGSHGNGDALLRREDLVFIMPGGSKEAWKSSRYRYRLLWQGRYGFVRLAIRNRCPIVPSANVGTDDTYHVFFDGYTTAAKLLRTKNAFFPVSLPVGIGLLPFPVKLTQYVGEPIAFGLPPEAADDPDVVRRCQEQVKAAVYDLIDRGLREREERTAPARAAPRRPR